MNFTELMNIIADWAWMNVSLKLLYFLMFTWVYVLIIFTVKKIIRRVKNEI